MDTTTQAQKILKKLGYFFLVSSLGAMMLIVFWSAAGDMGNALNDNASNERLDHMIFAYYVINSLLLLMASIFFSFKKYKTFSFFSIIFAISVLSSIFIFREKELFTTILETLIYLITQNLFVQTIREGMYWGFVFGGAVLVPMFIISAYLTAKISFLYIKDKLNEERILKLNEDLRYAMKMFLILISLSIFLPYLITMLYELLSA